MHFFFATQSDSGHLRVTPVTPRFCFQMTIDHGHSWVFIWHWRTLCDIFKIDPRAAQNLQTCVQSDCALFKPFTRLNFLRSSVKTAFFDCLSAPELAAGTHAFWNNVRSHFFVVKHVQHGPHGLLKNISCRNMGLCPCLMGEKK